jgi:hypothetical protein
MNNIWESWDSSQLNIAYSHAAIVDYQGLSIELFEALLQQPSGKIECSSMLSYQVTQPSFHAEYQQFISNNPNKINTSVFLIKNSTYAAWLAEESYGILDEDRRKSIYHLCVITKEIIIDVVTFYKPTFIRKNE